MNEKNNVRLEGAIIECSLGKTDEKQIQYASMLICTSERKKDGTTENSYHRIRFAVSSENAKKIARISSDCMANKARLSSEGSDQLKEIVRNNIRVTGELRNDNKRQPVIIAQENDVTYPDKISQTNGNSISLEGTLHSVVNSSSIAATILISVPAGKSRNKTLVPVIIDSRKNPVEWASITSGRTKPDDIVKVSGKLDGRLYGNGPDNAVLLRFSVISETISIKNNLSKRQTKPVPKI